MCHSILPETARTFLGRLGRRDEENKLITSTVAGSDYLRSYQLYGGDTVHEVYQNGIDEKGAMVCLADSSGKKLDFSIWSENSGLTPQIKCQAIKSLENNHGKIDCTKPVGLAKVIQCQSNKIVHLLDLDGKPITLLFGKKDAYALADPITGSVVAAIKSDSIIDQNNLTANTRFPYLLYPFGKTQVKTKKDER